LAGGPDGDDAAAVSVDVAAAEGDGVGVDCVCGCCGSTSGMAEVSAAVAAASKPGTEDNLVSRMDIVVCNLEISEETADNLSSQRFANRFKNRVVVTTNWLIMTRVLRCGMGLHTFRSCNLPGS